MVAMILLICFSMTRAFLRDSRMRQPPPCDDTVAMSVDLEAEDIEEGQEVFDTLHKSGDENERTSSSESLADTEEETGTCSRISTSETSTIASALGLSENRETAIGTVSSVEVEGVDGPRYLGGPPRVLGAVDISVREEDEPLEHHRESR